MTLYSSHATKKSDLGNSINQEKYKNLVDMIFDSKKPGFKIIQKAIKNRIGEKNVGRQFTAADPLTVLGFLYPNIVTTKKVFVTIDPKNKSPRGYKMSIKETEDSKLEVVGKIESGLFKEKMEAVFSELTA
uniref:Uncharacterized protein n=1 Tax=Ditylenchus dipsaci TaxID=166011 RepID=A0A915D010_9BILA